MLVDGKEIKRTQRKFKYRAGKFFLKKDSYFEVEHVIFFRFGGKQFFLKLNEKNNLILRTESSGMAFFIIIPIGGYGGDDKQTEFKKVDK